MPYTTQERRHQYERFIAQLCKKLVDAAEDDFAKFAGDLTYIFTAIIAGTIKGLGARGCIINFCLLNEIAGSIWSTTMEYWDQVLRPYEARKRTENGPIYPQP